MIKIILKKGRDESLHRFHPWVFSGAIAQVQGDILEVLGSDGLGGTFLVNEMVGRDVLGM